MICTIENVLPSADVAALVAYINENCAAFSSGAETAGWHARAVKSNEQIDSGAAETIAAKVSAALLASDMFRAVARPKAFAKIMVSRYSEGMQYGLHVDDAFINAQRTDLSFTLFLSPPESYDEGELVIAATDDEIAIKLNAGALVVYPSTTLHRVNQVSRGERLVVVGWVTSHVRDAGEREILLDIDAIIQAARACNMSHDDMARLIKVKMNLLRKWSDG